MTATPTIIDCEQRSNAWLAARRGLVTGSRCVDVLAKTKKGEEGAARRNYRAEIITEILTGQTPSRYITKEMEWGVQQEPYARAAYEQHHGGLVEACGFMLHPTIHRFGCSPDGLVDANGMVQIKCPITANHIEWMLAGTIPLEHMPQLLAELACSGRKWVDFVSFDPRMPRHLQLYVCRFARQGNEQHIAQLEAEVIHFNAEVDQVLARLPQAKENRP